MRFMRIVLLLRDTNVRVVLRNLLLGPCSASPGMGAQLPACQGKISDGDALGKIGWVLRAPIACPGIGFRDSDSCHLDFRLDSERTNRYSPFDPDSG